MPTPYLRPLDPWEIGNQRENRGWTSVCRSRKRLINFLSSHIFVLDGTRGMYGCLVRTWRHALKLGSSHLEPQFPAGRPPTNRPI